MDCFVRENLALDHFRVSAGERMGFKQGRLAKRHGQVLELCAPADCWPDVARIVAATDSLGRAVRRNRNLTVAWAERMFHDRRRTHEPA